MSNVRSRRATEGRNAIDWVHMQQPNTLCTFWVVFGARGTMKGVNEVMVVERRGDDEVDMSRIAILGPTGEIILSSRKQSR